MPAFYDTHAHLGFSDFARDLPEVIERAAVAGIGKIITIGTDLESSAQAIRIAEQFPNVFAAVGWHPTQALEAPPDVRPALRELAGHPKVVAIGETGLDYHWRPDDAKEQAGFEQYKERQKEIFRQQLEVAAERGLNCVIHQRESFEDAVAEMQPFSGRTRAVFHCFSEDAGALRRVLALGSLVSFTGIVTFKNGRNAREALAATPLGQFMFETDCPFLAPVPFRGKRCEPAYVREISLLAAEVKSCSLEELSAATLAAAHGFFPKIAEKS
ncbi:MAG: TatD family hydrolase [Verrucomicrobiota bacterium]